jgi:hypothetical protein
MRGRVQLPSNVVSWEVRESAHFFAFFPVDTHFGRKDVYLMNHAT